MTGDKLVYEHSLTSIMLIADDKGKMVNIKGMSVTLMEQRR